MANVYAVKILFSASFVFYSVSNSGQVRVGNKLIYDGIGFVRIDAGIFKGIEKPGDFRHRLAFIFFVANNRDRVVAHCKIEI